MSEYSPCNRLTCDYCEDRDTIQCLGKECKRYACDYCSDSGTDKCEAPVFVREAQEAEDLLLAADLPLEVCHELKALPLDKLREVLKLPLKDICEPLGFSQAEITALQNGLSLASFGQ